MKTLKDLEIENYNFKTEKFIYYYKSKDVKKKLLEFDNWLYNNRHKEVDYFTIQDIRNKLHKIFGDFEK